MGRKVEEFNSSQFLETPGKLLNLVDKDLLRELLRAFTLATGLTANIVTTEGKSIFSRADAQNMCGFCKLIRKLECKKGINRCVGAYKRAGKQAAQYGEPNIFRCPAGLVEWIAPIIRDNIHIGSIICGQVLLWEPEEFFWIELEEKNREITDDIAPLIVEAKKLQVISPEKVQAASRLLGIMANYIVQSVWDEVRRRNEVEYQRSLLEKEADTRRELEEKLNANSATYFYDQTRGLTNALSDGEYDKARSIFTVIVADIVAEGKGLGYVYARIFELLILVSHVAIGCGVDPDECMQDCMDYCNNERFIENSEGLVKLAKTNFEKQLAAIDERARPSKRAVDDMRGFIKANFHEPLSLADVADSVQLSPYYASRLFKGDQGMTIMEYVTKLKMEEAKYLLSNPRHHIDEVARQLGYDDPSYFARVFKKYAGVSPSKYRLNH